MLILIDVQYLWNVVFSITKELDGQNNLLSTLLPNVKSPPQQNFLSYPLGDSPYLLILLEKPCK